MTVISKSDPNFLEFSATQWFSFHVQMTNDSVWLRTYEWMSESSPALLPSGSGMVLDTTNNEARLSLFDQDRNRNDATYGEWVWNTLGLDTHIGLQETYLLTHLRGSFVWLPNDESSPPGDGHDPLTEVEELRWASLKVTSGDDPSSLPFSVPVMPRDLSCHTAQDVPFGNLPRPLVCRGDYPNLRVMMPDLARVARAVAVQTGLWYKFALIMEGRFAGLAKPGVARRKTL